MLSGEAAEGDSILMELNESKDGVKAKVLKQNSAVAETELWNFLSKNQKGAVFVAPFLFS